MSGSSCSLPSLHALGTWPRAPGSPDLRGQAQEAWAGPSITGRSPVVSRPPRCPRAFLGQELGSRGLRPGQPPARRAECRPHRGRSLQLCRGGPRGQPGTSGLPGCVSAADPSRLSEAPATFRLLLCLCPGLYPRGPPGSRPPVEEADHMGSRPWCHRLICGLQPGPGARTQTSRVHGLTPGCGAMPAGRAFTLVAGGGVMQTVTVPSKSRAGGRAQRSQAPRP